MSDTGALEGMDGHEAVNSRTRGKFMFGLGDLVVVKVDMFKDSFKCQEKPEEFSRKFILVNNRKKWIMSETRRKMLITDAVLWCLIISSHS